MTNSPARRSAAKIEAEAARWVMRIARHGRTGDIAHELEVWLGEDTRHRGALLQAQAALHLATHSVDEGASRAGLPAHRPYLTRRTALFGTAAAGIAASLAGLALWLPWQRYDTATGEVRRVPLSDGSVAQINTQSELAVRLEPERRTVVLDHGEAWFQVAKDKKRPFTVEAGRIRVRALGTAFSVRRRDGGADVLVTEGIVEAWADGAEGAGVRIGAGERAFIADNAAVELAKPAHGDVDRALAWRNGKIDLAGEPLTNAIAEFNRYNERRLVLADPAIGNEGFYGIFRIDDPEGFARAVHQSLDVAVAMDDREIRIGGH